MPLTQSKQIIFSSLFLCIVAMPFVRAQTNPQVRKFEPSAWTVEDRIKAVETGLIPTAVILTGEPASKVTLADELKENSVPGLSVAVVDNYKLAWAKGYGVTDVRKNSPVTPETLFSAGGITKAVTAVAVLRLVDAHKLDLDQDVNTLLKSWKIPDNQYTVGHPITLRELLSHSSGLDDHYPESSKPGDKLPTLLQLLKGEPPSQAEAVQVFHQPGAMFEYSSASFLVVQQLLIDVFHKPFEEIVREAVLEPAGMRHSTFEQPTTTEPTAGRATGHFIRDNHGPQAEVRIFPGQASSGLWTTPSDLAQFLIGLQKSGEKGGLLTKASYENMLKPVVNNVGLGFFLAGKGDTLRIRVRGSDGLPFDSFAAWLTGYSQGGKGAIIMTNCASAFPVGFALLRSIAAEYGWTTYTPVRTLAKVDPRIYQQYVGNYQLGRDVVTISTDNGILLGQINNSPKIPLLPYSPSSFFVNTDLLHEAEVKFVRKDDGAVDALVMQYPYDSYTAPRIH